MQKQNKDKQTHGKWDKWTQTNKQKKRTNKANKKIENDFHKISFFSCSFHFILLFHLLLLFIFSWNALGNTNCFYLFTALHIWWWTKINNNHSHYIAKIFSRMFVIVCLPHQCWLEQTIVLTSFCKCMLVRSEGIKKTFLINQTAESFYFGQHTNHFFLFVSFP